MNELERFMKLKEMGYEYNHLTGQIISKSGKQRQGNVSGYGYLSFGLEGTTYTVYAHRYAYWFYHNRLPKVIDHQNGNKLDNRISNLRSTTQTENLQNQSVIKPHPKKPNQNGKYQTRISVNGNLCYIGQFETLEEMYKATILAKLMYHPGYVPRGKDLELLNNTSVTVDMTDFYKKMKNIQKQQIVEAFAHPIENFM